MPTNKARAAPVSFWPVAVTNRVEQMPERGQGRHDLSAWWHGLALPLVIAGCWAWSGWLAVQRLPTLPAALQGQDFDVQGVVTNMPQRGAQSLRFVLSLEQIALVPKHGAPGLPADFVMPERFFLSWYPGRSASDGAEEQALIVPDVHDGQRWRMRVRLKTPHG